MFYEKDENNLLIRITSLTLSFLNVFLPNRITEVRIFPFSVSKIAPANYPRQFWRFGKLFSLIDVRKILPHTIKLNALLKLLIINIWSCKNWNKNKERQTKTQCEHLFLMKSFYNKKFFYYCHKF